MLTKKALRVGCFVSVVDDQYLNEAKSNGNAEDSTAGFISRGSIIENNSLMFVLSNLRTQNMPRTRSMREHFPIA